MEPVVKMDPVVTDKISDTINDSHNLLKYHRVDARINKLDPDNDILICGNRIEGPAGIEDEGHTRIIQQMALVAWISGKQLRIEPYTFANGRLFAKTASIVDSK